MPSAVPDGSRDNTDEEVLRNSYLTKMGIDVWTLRGPLEADTGALLQPAVDGSMDDSLDDSIGCPAKEGEVKDGHEFHLCFLNYRSFAICLSLGINQEVISPGARRFCDDVALALNGSDLRPGINNLKWPIRGEEDRSVSAAASVLAERLNGLPGLILIFGDSSASLIPGVQGLANNQVVEVNGRQVLRLNSIDHLCQGSAGKRSLWQIIQAHKKSP
jgi:hypothetical protein